MRRSRMPERSTIHSSVVSRRASRSALVTTLSGRALPHPVITAPAGTASAGTLDAWPGPGSRAVGLHAQPCDGLAGGHAFTADGPGSPTTIPAKGVRTSAAPDRAEEVAHRHRRPLAGRDARTWGERPPGPGAAKPGDGLEHTGRGRDHHALGGVEVLALVGGGIGVPASRSRRWRSRRCRDRRGWPPREARASGSVRRASAGEHPAGPDLDEPGGAHARQGLEALAPPHGAAQLGRQQPGPVRRSRCGRGRRRWRPRGSRAR